MTAVEHGIAEAEHPHYVASMQQPETAKSIHVYLNGDKFYPGRKFVVNRRHVADFNGFLNQVTMGIKAPFGAVRNIYTPQSGHRVNDLSQLQTGMQLVAGGVERFRKLEYREIGSKRKQKPRRNYLEIRSNPHKMLVSARWRKYIKDPCQIYVYGNGDINAPALRLLLIPRTMKSWDLVLSEITEKICYRTGQAVRKLYDMNYRLLNDPSELENGHYYVAVGSEKLKRYPYGELHSSKTSSPRKIIHHHPLPPIKSQKPRPPGRDDGENTYSKMYAQRKQHKAHIEETTVMGASAATGYRPLRARKFKPAKPSTRGSSPEGAAVFPPKPVKVKRMSGASNGTTFEPLPSADNPDGVFKTETKEVKAETVDEDEHTQLDLPIDQVKAVEVEEEAITEVMSARSDDVITEKQEITVRESDADDADASPDQHLDDDKHTEVIREDENATTRDQDDESIKEEALVAASTAILLADTEVTVDDDDMIEKAEEHHVTATEETVEAQDQLSLTPSTPLDAEPVDQAESDHIDSIPKEDTAAIETTPAPESDAPEDVASEKPLTPEPELPAEANDEQLKSDETTEVLEATVEISSPEATGENQDEAAEENRPASNRSVTPSSPKPREEEGDDAVDDSATAVDADVALAVAGSVPESPKKHESLNEDETISRNEASEEAAAPSVDTPRGEDDPKEDVVEGDVKDEASAEEPATIVHESEDNVTPATPEKNASSPDPDATVAEENQDSDESEKRNEEEEASSEQSDAEDNSKDSGEEVSVARPDSNAVAADDDRSASDTPSTKRSLANGDAAGIPADVQP